MDNSVYLEDHSIPETGTMEDRWGILGIIICRNCRTTYPLHLSQYREGMIHRKKSEASPTGEKRCGKFIWKQEQIKSYNKS